MNQNLSLKFIDELLRYLNRNDAISIGKLLKLKNEKYREVYFKDDAKRYYEEKLQNLQNESYLWAEVIENYILARNCIYNEDFPNAFESLTKSFKNLIDLIKVCTLISNISNYYKTNIYLSFFRTPKV